MTDAILLLTILAGSESLGRWPIRRFLGPDISPLSFFLLSTGLGLGAVSYVILLAGFLGVLYPAFFKGILVVLAVSGVVGLPDLRRRIIWRASLSPFEIFFGLVFGISSSFSLVAALVPPVYYDIVSYHYAAPGQYMMANRIFFVPENLHASVPFTMEMLYMLGLSLRGPILANLINGVFGIMAGLAVFSLASRAIGRRGAFVAAAVFQSSASVMELSVLATSDIGVTFYAILTVICLDRWSVSNERRWIAAAGVACGLAMGCKYPALLMAFGASLSAILLHARRTGCDRRDLIRDTLTFAATALLVFSPWAVKNLLHTGNPLYPFFPSLFGGFELRPEGLRQLFAEGRHVVLTIENLPRILAAPLLLLHSYQWQDSQIAEGFGYAFSIFVPIALALRDKSAPVRFLLSWAIPYLFLWMVSTSMVRFFIPNIAILCVVVAYAFERIEAWKFPARVFARALLISAIFFSFYSFVWLNPMTRAQLIAGFSSKGRADFLDRYYPLVDTARFVNQSLPSGAKLLFVGESRGFYFERPFVAPSAHDVNPIEEIVTSAGDETGVAEAILAQGITHIVYSAGELRRFETQYLSFRWTAEDRDRFRRFLENRARLIHAGRAALLYEILRD